MPPRDPSDPATLPTLLDARSDLAAEIGQGSAKLAITGLTICAHWPPHCTHASCRCAACPSAASGYARARRLGSSVGALACRPLWPAIGTAHGCSMQPRTARRASPTWTACGASTRSIDSRSHGEGTESSPPYTWSGQRRSGVAVARFRRCGLAYLPFGAMGSVAVSPTTCDQLGT